MSKDDKNYYVDILHSLSNIEKQLKEFNVVNIYDSHDMLQEILFSPPILT
jgi:hypothetical protein